MFICTQDYELRRSGVTELLPLRIRRYFYGIDTDSITEVRLRRGKPVCVCTADSKQYMSKSGKISTSLKNPLITTSRDIEEAVEFLTSSSVYSCQDQIKNGYISAAGGNRIGICGTMTPDGGYVSDICGLNFRFAHEIIGAADKAFDAVYNGGAPKSTLIVSLPGCGKTTFLRDLIRSLSNSGISVSVVDERGELAACGGGEDGFDLGINTDVFSMCPKIKGMEMMIRSMSPQMIAVDEIGSSDTAAIYDAAKCGVGVLATAHAGDWRCDIPKELLACFKCVVSLSDRHGAGTFEELVYV